MVFSTVFLKRQEPQIQAFKFFNFAKIWSLNCTTQVVVFLGKNIKRLFAL